MLKFFKIIESQLTQYILNKRYLTTQFNVISMDMVGDKLIHLFYINDLEIMIMSKYHF